MDTAFSLLARRPERLVVTGFRNIMAACELGDMHCWEAVWQHYIAELGAGPARRLVGELQYWTRGVRCHAGRPLSYYPQCCRQLCHDECMALSLVAAAQAGDEATGLLAARCLSGSSAPAGLDGMWHATLPFAAALSETGQTMHPVTAEAVAALYEANRAASCRRCPRLN